MLKIRLDNTDIEVPEGTTILDAARMAGFSIPTLCHSDGVPHYSSCMVCMVRDKVKNTFIPSCSALVQAGMDIDVSGDEVISIRRKAVELLLSEHRAECEAPCRVVCPMGYNIPLMNRLFASNDIDGVYKLIVSEIGSGELNCFTCKAYCENACRRKKIDEPLTIRKTRMFIASELSEKGVINLEKGVQKKEKLKRFTSRTGKVETDELSEWLKECNGQFIRHHEISRNEDAMEEAAACMHCDCRAADNCKLRDVADILSVKDPSGKVVNAPIRKKINSLTGLIFENAKCIKCGLCVRVCDDSVNEPSLCFIARGFISIISEPLTSTFDEVLTVQAEKAADICPTGALKIIDRKK